MMSGDGVMEFLNLHLHHHRQFRLSQFSRGYCSLVISFLSKQSSLAHYLNHCFYLDIELSNLTCFSDLDLISKVATLVQSTKFS